MPLERDWTMTQTKKAVPPWSEPRRVTRKPLSHCRSGQFGVFAKISRSTRCQPPSKLSDRSPSLRLRTPAEFKPGPQGDRATGRQGDRGLKSRISTRAIFQNNGKRIKELKASTLNLHHMGVANLLRSALRRLHAGGLPDSAFAQHNLAKITRARRHHSTWPTADLFVEE